MKKLLLLFAIMLSVVGAWAQTEAIKTSTNVTSPEHVFELKNANGWVMAGTTGSTGASTTPGKFAFFEGTKDGAFKVYSIDEAKWVSYTKNSSYDNGENFAVLIDSQDEAMEWNFAVVQRSGADVYQIAPYNNTGVASKYWNYFNGTSATHNTIGLWQGNAASDAGSAWIIEEVLGTVTIIYNYKYGGEVKSTEELTARIGKAFPEPTTVPDYITYALPEGDVTSEDNGKTFEIECTQNLPFEVSEDYATAKWYYMTIRNGSKFVATSTTIPYPNRTADSQHVLNDARWAFVGNPFDGIKVLNKEAGEGKYLGVGDNSNVIMLETEEAWVLEKVNEGFVLLADAGTTKYVHDLSGTLKIWNDGSAKTDGGSVLRVEECPILRVSTNNYIADVQEKYQSLSSNHQDEVGYYTSQSLEELNTALENANALFEVTTGLPTGKIFIGTMQTEMVPGQWYFVHTPRIPDQNVGPSNYAINSETIYGTYAGIIQSRGGLVTDNTTGIVIS